MLKSERVSKSDFSAYCGSVVIKQPTDCRDAGTRWMTTGAAWRVLRLGLLGVQPAADRLWAFFEKTRSQSKSLWVGPLWGLIDLGDHRAADALVELLADKRAFYEKYGFLSRAGDQRVVIPLIAEILDGAGEIRGEATWALTGIAHRLGRDRFSEVLTGGGNALTINHIS